MATPSTEQRELDLVEKVDLRILNVANNEQKLQELLGKFLVPLLLKGASEHASVRAKVATVAQRLKLFIKPPGVVLPVASLVQQFKTTESPVVRHLDIVFIQHSIDRLSVTDRRALLPDLFRGISRVNSSTPALFDIVLQTLPVLQLPARGSKEDETFAADIGLSDAADADYVAERFGRVLLLSRAGTGSTTPSLSAEDVSFFQFDQPDAWLRSGTNLAETRIRVANFLASGAFPDSSRFMPALYAAAHADGRVASVGEDLLKRSRVSLETPDVVERLFAAHAALPPTYRIRILGLLSRSAVATSYGEAILQTVRRNMDLSATTAVTPAASGEAGASARSRGLEMAKLYRATFEFINWTARMGPGAQTTTAVSLSIGPPLIAYLRGYIVEQGWPVPTVAAGAVDYAPLRAKAYETIGMLAKGASLPLADRLDLARWFFRALTEDPTAEAVVNIDGALSSLSSVFSQDGAATADDDFERLEAEHSLHEMLLAYIDLADHDAGGPPHVRRSARHAAAKWANLCLPLADPVARWIDILAAAGRRGERSDVVEEGHKGLDPWTYYSHAPESAASAALPSWPALVDTFFKTPLVTAAAASGADDAAMDIDSRSVFCNFSGDKLHGAFPLAVQYCSRILLLTALTDPVATSAASATIFRVQPGWEQQLETLVRSDRRTRAAVRAYLRDLAEADGRALMDLLEATFEGMLRPSHAVAEPCGLVFVELASLAPAAMLDAQAGTSMSPGPSLANRAPELLPLARSNKKELRMLAAAAVGILGAHPTNSPESVARLQTALVEAAAPWKTAVGSELNATEGAFVALAHLLSRRVFYGVAAGDIAAVATATSVLFPTAVEISGASASFQDALFDALAQLWTAGIRCLPGDSDTKPAVTAFVDMLVAPAKKGNERAIAALGRLALAVGDDAIPAETATPTATTTDAEAAAVDVTGFILTRLYALYELRQTEVHFAIGGAIAAAVACWDADVVELSLDVEPASNADAAFRTPRRSQRLAAVLDKLLEDGKTTKPALLKASGIWLFTLIQHGARLPEIQGRLRACQAAFMRLLGARDELVQETASRGLALVYETGDAPLKGDLVRDLVSAFTGSGTRLKVDADTELFDAGALPTGEGSSVTSYRDIVNLANEVGDQTLVYKFMALATNAATWSTRSAFGRFGLSSLLSDAPSAVDPKLYPKLFRYRFDPNPNVRRSMDDIWKALVKDDAAVIDVHLDAILQDLLRSILGKEWRVREASCAAIADLVQGRPFAQYERYYADVWARALKVLDDVKGSVREAALRLCITLSNTLVRQLEAHGGSIRTEDDGDEAKVEVKGETKGQTEGETADKATNQPTSAGIRSTGSAAAMMREALPFLMSEKGIESGVEDVKVFATITVIKVAKHGGAALRPYVASMVPQLLGLLSTIEPQALNYHYVRAGEADREKLDKMRSAMVSQSPISEAIENALRSVDGTVMQALGPALEAAMKGAVGMPTKIGCGRVLSTLATRHRAAFAPYAGRFLQLLVRQGLLDGNDEVSQGYARAAAYVVRVAPDRARERFATRLVDLYLGDAGAGGASGGGGDDGEARREKVADAVLALSKISPDHFHELEARLLPLAFLGRFDHGAGGSSGGDSDYVRTELGEVWSKHAGSNLSVARYVPEIAALVRRALDTAQWALRHAGARAAAAAVAAVLGASDLSGVVNETQLRALWPLYETAMALKTFDGKEALLEVLPDFVAKARPFWTADARVAAALRKIATVEAKRNNDAYRVHALRCLGRVAAAREDIDMWPDVVAIATPHLEALRSWDAAELTEVTSSSAMDVDSGAGKAKAKVSSAAAARERLVRQTAANGLEAIATGYSRPALRADAAKVLSDVWTALAPFVTTDAFAPVRRSVWYKAAGDLLAAAAAIGRGSAPAPAPKDRTEDRTADRLVTGYLSSLDTDAAEVGTEEQRSARAKALASVAKAVKAGALGAVDETQEAQEQMLRPVRTGIEGALKVERSLDVQKLLREALAETKR